MSAEKQKVEYRISKTYGFFLVALTFIYDMWELIVDALGTALVGVFGAGLIFWSLNLVTGAATVVLLWLIFKIKGVSLSKSPKRLVVSSVTFIGEQMPTLDTTMIMALGWTIGTAILVLMSRAEDRGLKVPNSKPKDETSAQSVRKRARKVRQSGRILKRKIGRFLK